MAEIAENSKSDKGRTHKVSTRIDMTPMVDLGFLLITFFMLATTFSKPKTMEINMPFEAVKTKPIPNKNAVTVILGENDKVYYFFGLPEINKVKRTDFSKDGLRKVLAERIKTNADTFVIIKVSDTSKYKNLVDVIDEMAITNNKRYAIADFTEADRLFITQATNN
jgi:biopolymer transport protein ExbD